MGLLERFREVDARVEDGVANWAARSRVNRWFGWRPTEPRGATARALWEVLPDDDREALRRMAMFGREPHDPRNALVVADLADDHLRWQWKGLGYSTSAMLVLLGIVAVVTGEFRSSLFAGPVGAGIGITTGVYRIDRARRANLRKAQDAGLV